MTTKLERISELSKQHPEMKFNSIGHLINIEMLKECHYKMDGRKAVGIDGISKEEYNSNLDSNLKQLVEKLKNKSYRPRPARKVEMPKENGLSLIQWIQDMYPEIINIILTGYPDFNYARSAISLGVYRYLLKPIAFDELEETIASAVEKLEEYKTKNKPEADPEMADAVNTIKKYLESHYSEVITRKKIEELVHLNQDHINREFKKQTGYTLMEYVQHYRILMAKKMLRETTLSISEISIRTGYDSPAYFSKIFKKQTERTPLEYRAAKAKG